MMNTLAVALRTGASAGRSVGSESKPRTQSGLVHAAAKLDHTEAWVDLAHSAAWHVHARIDRRHRRPSRHTGRRFAIRRPRSCHRLGARGEKGAAG